MDQMQEDIGPVSNGKAGFGRRVGGIDRRRLLMDCGETGQAVAEEALVA